MRIEKGKYEKDDHYWELGFTWWPEGRELSIMLGWVYYDITFGNKDEDKSQ